MNRKLRIAQLMLLEDLQMSDAISLLHQQVGPEKDGVFDQHAQDSLVVDSLFLEQSTLSSVT